MAPLTVGVLGAGHIGSVHIQTVRAIDDASLAAVADIVPENRERAAKLGAPETYEDYEELLATEGVDVAVIALPPFLHAEAARRAAEVGCDVFVEKPLARTTAEGRSILDAADEAGVAVGVDHTLRYQPDVRTLKERYDEGSLGHVPFAHVSRVNSGPFESPPATHSIPSWKVDPAATGGGVAIDLGIHLLDVLEWFFGDMEVHHASLDRQFGLDYEDAATVVLESERTGTTAVLNCGYFQWEEPPDVNLTVRLDGVAETVRNDEYVPNFFLNAARSAIGNVVKRLVGIDPDYFGPTYYYRAHHAALADFLAARDEGRSPPVDGEDGLRALELVEQTYRAADTPPEPEHDEAIVGPAEDRATVTAGDHR